MGTALITGASSGLGLEYAWQLATAKHDLVLVARNTQRLELVADQLRQVAGVHVEVLPADLSDPEQLEKVAERLRVGTITAQTTASEQFSGPRAPVGLLVNNAGYALNRPFVAGDLAAELQSLDVLVRAVLVLSHASAGQMVSRGRGAILNVSSVAALMAGGTYSAHKIWVRTFTESLAVELQGTGVTATVVAPGLTRTEFHARAQIDGASYPELAWLNPNEVVTQSLNAVRRGQVIVTPSWRYQLAVGTLRVLPRWAVRGIGSVGVHGEH